MQSTKLLVFALVFILCGNLSAQDTYYRNYGLPGSDVNYLITTSDGGTLVGSHSGGGIVLFKLDCYGEEQWSRLVNSSSFNLSCKGIAETTDGGYVVCAYYSDAGYSKMGVIRFDSNGDYLWSNKYYYSSSNSAWDLIAGPDGSTMLTGGGCSGDNYLMKIAANGDMEWQKQYRTTDYGGTGMNFVKAANGDYLLLISHYQFSTNDRDMAVLRLDPDGGLIWFKRYGTDATEYVEAITEDSDGNILFTCNSDIASPVLNERDIILTKIDSDGNLIWSKIYSNSKGDHAYGIVENAEGKYTLTGSRFDTVDNVQILLASVDKSGNWEWAKSWGAWGYEGAKGVMLTTTGKIKVYGGDSGMFIAQIESDGTGLCSSVSDTFTDSSIVLNTFDMTASSSTASLAFTTDTLGVTITNDILNSTFTCGGTPSTCIVTVGVEEDNTLQATIAPYPNPFSDETTFVLPKELMDKDAVLKLHDVFGKQVGQYTMNQRSITLHRNDLSSGIYFYAVQAGGSTYSGKLVVE